MPRVVRNFWIRTSVSGAERSVETGPRAKDGEFTTTVHVRERGEIREGVYTIDGLVSRDGKTLTLRVLDEDENVLHERSFER